MSYEKAGRQRQHEVAVGDRAAKRRLLGPLDIEVDPLVVWVRFANLLIVSCMTSSQSLTPSSLPTWDLTSSRPDATIGCP